MAVDARGKLSAVFHGPVGAVCASTGPAASTAAWSGHGSAACDQTPGADRIRDRPDARAGSPVAAKRVDPQVGRGGDRCS